MKLITLTILSFSAASFTQSINPKNSDKSLNAEVQKEQLTPTEQLFKEVSENFMMDGKPIHPGVLHEFHPDIWKCGGNPVTTINLSDISCYLNRIDTCHGIETEIHDEHYVIFNCGGTDCHCSEECEGYLLYRKMHIQDDGAHLLFFASHTGGSDFDYSYLLVKPTIKTMHKGITKSNSDNEVTYELGAKEYVALELVGFYDQEPTFIPYEK